MPHDERVVTYAEAAAAHGRAQEDGDSESANAAHDRLATIYRELREEGRREQLLPLLQDPDPSVKTWAAAHALEFAPTEGERVLQQVAERETGTIGFSAEQTLRTWRDGQLTFP